MSMPIGENGFGSSPASTRAARSLSDRLDHDGPTMVLVAGDRVTHERFGLGTVVSAEGAGAKADATIDFGSAGIKRLLLRYAPVIKL